MRLQPIYCRTGEVTGWLDEYLLLDSEGRCRAYIARSLIFEQRGRHIGYIESGLVRDRIGEVVGFLADAEADFALPEPAPAGPPPCLILPHSFPKLQEVGVSRLLFDAPCRWSALNWDAFLRS